ncbi:hypothetical protein C8R47DRAFT_1231438 [Mycena vitilis]|nr:hypothetical protein C8R47DRAFT_1231438 [Mycena vitilis]
MNDTPGPPGSKSNPYVLVPAPPGTKFNPFLLPDSPLRPSVFRRTFAKKKQRDVDENTAPMSSERRTFIGEDRSPPPMSAVGMRALENRISELGIGASTSSTAARTDNIAQNTAAPALAHPRPRRAILALEASLLELRTARSSGSTPGGRVPLGNNDNRSFGRAQRRELARRGPAGRVTNQMLNRGSRYPRCEPLDQGSLWSGGVAPPDQDAHREHHKCGICHMVKSHPVSYECGHGHCYACIRMWLELSWKCPECMTTMYRAPFRIFSEEAWISEAYPNWNNNSQVDYNWHGLVFPKRPQVVAVDAE